MMYMRGITCLSEEDVMEKRFCSNAYIFSLSDNIGRILG